MLKGKELIGRKIVALAGGERVDSVQDLIFDQQGNRVLALLVDAGGWFHAARVLPYRAVRTVGEDAVMIEAASDVLSANEDPAVTEAMQTKVGLVGLNLLTTDGKDLGRISDVYFDELTGRVVGYEATGGLFSDLSSGRTFVPAPESITIGAEAAIVPPAVAQAMQEQEPGGLQGALGTVTNNVRELSADANAQATTVQASGAAHGQTLPDGAVIRIQPDPAAQVVRQRASIVGRRVLRDVPGPNRSFVAVQGQIVTPELLERARTLDREAELAAAVEPLGSPVALPSASSVNDAVAVASERLAAGAQSVREGAAGFLDRAKGWINDTRDRAQIDAETAQVEGAVGRPVNRVVLDREDHIILNTGEIITHKAVERSRAAGVLNILLSSVSHEPVVIDPLAVRPQETGQAALESQPELRQITQPAQPTQPTDAGHVTPGTSTLTGDPKPGQ